MTALFITLGSAQVASSRVRLLQYIPYLASRGLHITVEPFFADQAGPARALPDLIRRLADARYVWTRMAALLRLARRHDIVVLQRVLPAVSCQRLLRAAARRLVFDFDDAIYTTHAGAGPVPANLGRRFAHMAAISDTVIAATPHLAARARAHASPVLEIPSTVDCDRLRPPASAPGAGPVVIGWIGSPSTSMYLDAALPVLERLTRDRGDVRVDCVGAAPAIARGSSIRVLPWTLESEARCLSAFDIGIMPQPDDEWARGKGGYKLLQYMACGLPSVASPGAVSESILEDGRTGLIARNESGWTDALRTLVNSAEERRTMGALARRAVEQRYALSGWAPAVYDAIVGTR